MDMNLLSRYRTELMGIAMLLVVWHHLPVVLPCPGYDFLQLNAGLGVDIFMLLSGMGIYFSMSRDACIRTYFIKRFIRIFPIYILVVVSVNLIGGNADFINILLQITTIGWWTQTGVFEWFIPNLVLLYLIFPILFVLLGRKNGYAYGVLLVSIAYLGVMSLPDGVDFQALYRYPVFFLGALLGKTIKEGISSKLLVAGFMLAMLIGLLLSMYAFRTFHQPGLDPCEVPLLKVNGWLFLPYLLVVTGFCLSATFFMQYRLMDIPCKLLALVGKMSLEIYLLHHQFILLTKYLTDTYHWSKPLTGVVLISLSFVAAYLLHKLNVMIADVLKNRLLH